MIRHPAPKILQRYSPNAPQVRIVEIHDHDCACDACQPSRLTRRELGLWMVGGILAGNAIAFAYDPTGAAAALLATVEL